MFSVQWGPAEEARHGCLTDSALGLGGYTGAEASITLAHWLRGNSQRHNSGRALNSIIKMDSVPTGMILNLDLILNLKPNSFMFPFLLDKHLLLSTFKGQKYAAHHKSRYDLEPFKTHLEGRESDGLGGHPAPEGGRGFWTWPLHLWLLPSGSPYVLVT